MQDESKFKRLCIILPPRKCLGLFLCGVADLCFNDGREIGTHENLPLGQKRTSHFVIPRDGISFFVTSSQSLRCSSRACDRVAGEVGMRELSIRKATPVADRIRV